MIPVENQPIVNRLNVYFDFDLSLIHIQKKLCAKQAQSFVKIIADTLAV